MIGSFGGEGGDAFAEVDDHLYKRTRKVARSSNWKGQNCNKLVKVSFKGGNISS